ncbi:hypothetical protein NCC49_004706 [Naganishia albida]|nr:hypothetical protein NCC49_004706 [Naganishia albida]
MPSIFKSKSKSPKIRKECIGPIVRLSTDQSLNRVQERQDPLPEPPLPPIPTSQGPPVVDRYIDYNRYTFAATHVPSTSAIEGRYGYIAVHSEVVLGPEEVQKVVEDISRELSERGLVTPLLFSSQSLDLSASKIHNLINAYTSSLTHPSRSTVYRESLCLAAPNEVAWFLRWAMSRVVRLVREDKIAESPSWGKGGKMVTIREREVRGLVDLREYEVWRGTERANHYPPRGIDLFFQYLPTHLSQLLTTLFELLSRLASHSHTSGLTPTHLSTLFGPLIFGLTDSTHSSAGVGTFRDTHACYVRSSGATEHLLLAWIRKQEAEHERLKGDFPRTLSAWAKGYPQGIMDDQTLNLGEARKEVRKVRVVKARRTVRSYSKDLLASCGDWATEWSQWGKVIRDGVVLTDIHRRRLGVKSDTLPFRIMGTPDHRKKTSGGSVDGGWNEFEDSGFMDEGLSEKLRFDLSEGAKAEATTERLTLTWTDFASPTGGFDRSTTALVNSLTLDQPLLAAQLSHWPAERRALHDQHVKAEKELPSFEAYEKELTIGEEWIEEAFLDCWADLVVGAGWGDHGELTYRRANWAIVECERKGSGPAVFVFEEMVPARYQNELVNPPTRKKSIFNRFPRHSEPSALPTTREIEFDARLKRHSTKVMTLSKPIGVGEIGSPLPSSPQTPRRDRMSGYMTQSPRSRGSVESPSAGRGKHASTSFEQRLHAAAPRIVGKGDVTVMRVDTWGLRVPVSGSGRSDADKWLELLDANRTKGTDAAAPVVSSLPPRPTDVSGFRVVSRESLKGQDKSDPFGRQDDSQEYGSYTPREANHLDPVSPCASSFYCVATKSSYNVLPKDGLQVEVPTSRAEAAYGSAVSADEESELEYLAPPLSAVGTQCTGSPLTATRNESVYTTGSVYIDHPPIDLGKPLPIPPATPHFSSQRDTLFSVIEGYGTRGADDARGFEERWYHAVPGQVLRPVPVHPTAPSEMFRDSTDTDNQDLRLDSVSLDDASSTWDAEHSDETVLDEITFESFAKGEESEVLEPPPKLEDIEAIARQHSSGRYGHGIPLDFVDEESEGGTEEDVRAVGLPRLGKAIA